MNNAQLTGMRQMHEDTKSVVKRTLTAKEMALRPHSLDRAGNMATCPDGSKWIWDDRFNHWAKWF